MEKVLWIIAIVEVIRALQNFIPMILDILDFKRRDNMYSEFIKSLKGSDKEMVRHLLEEFDKEWSRVKEVKEE